MSPGGAPVPVSAELPPPCGVVLVDKEPGWTSHDAVARCRRVFGLRRVGHAGTLDPDATGLLLVGLGPATRLLQFLTPLTKVYRGEVVLGVATSTLDASGSVTGTWDMGSVTVDAARRAARRLTGDIEQVPPMVSALKVGGQPLHALARRGVEVERAPRPVTVHRFDVGPGPEPGVLAVEVACSSGTYVRSLAADLGTALGGGAHLRRLRRTAVGSFSVDAAHRVDELGPGMVLSPMAALADLSRLTVSGEQAAMVAHGRPLPAGAVGADGGGPWAVVDAEDRLLAVYRSGTAATIRPAVVLAAR